MKLTIINSNSAGNCYLLESSSGQVLMIECGVQFKKIRHALDFDLSKVVGAIVTHEHKDHCVAVQEVANAGINIYASFGTIGEWDPYHHRFHPITNKLAFDIGEFSVLPFDVRHDCKEPMCFLIRHEECGLVLFLTDSYYVEYVFSGLNNIIVEANYCQAIVDRKVREGSAMKFLRNRVLESHMSIKTCKEFLKANDLSAVNNIVLIHLSDSNSDANRFQQEVQELTGKNVHVSDAGMVIENFNKIPF